MCADRITDEADLRNGLEESPASRLSRKYSRVETESILLSSEEPRSEDIGISELVGDDAGDEMNRFPTGLTFSTVCSGGTLNSPGYSPQGKAGVENGSAKGRPEGPVGCAQSLVPVGIERPSLLRRASLSGEKFESGENMFCRKLLEQ